MNALFTLILLVISVYLPNSSAFGKEIEFNCKTEKGRITGYVINTNPPSVKSTNIRMTYTKNPYSVKSRIDDTKFKIVEFSPTKFVFKVEYRHIPKNPAKNYKQIHNMTGGYGEDYWEEEFIYSINRENLSYQLTHRKDTNIIEMKEQDWNGFGKCYIVPPKPPVVWNYYR